MNGLKMKFLMRKNYYSTFGIEMPQYEANRITIEEIENLKTTLILVTNTEEFKGEKNFNITYNYLQKDKIFKAILENEFSHNHINRVWGTAADSIYLEERNQSKYTIN